MRRWWISHDADLATGESHMLVSGPLTPDGSVEVVPAVVSDIYWQALTDIAGLEGWQKREAGEIAREALEAGKR